MEFFIVGLKDESWGGVLLLRPTTFMQAFELSQLKEEFFDKDRI